MAKTIVPDTGSWRRIPEFSNFFTGSRYFRIADRHSFGCKKLRTCAKQNGMAEAMPFRF
jgi:hypothetical protein